MVAAGAALAGLAGFLFGTEKGKNTTKRLKVSGNELANRMGVMLKDGQKKIEELRERRFNRPRHDAINPAPVLQEAGV